jgi:hypothetical protein
LSQQGWRHCHQLIFCPKPHYGNEASALNPKLADRLDRCASNLNTTC